MKPFLFAALALLFSLLCSAQSDSLCLVRPDGSPVRSYAFADTIRIDSALVSEPFALHFKPAATTGAVDFRINGTRWRSEGTAPFSLNGDAKGTFNPFNPTERGITNPFRLEVELWQAMRQLSPSIQKAAHVLFYKPKPPVVPIPPVTAPADSVTVLYLKVILNSVEIIKTEKQPAPKAGHP